MRFHGLVSHAQKGECIFPAAKMNASIWNENAYAFKRDNRTTQKPKMSVSKECSKGVSRALSRQWFASSIGRLDGIGLIRSSLTLGRPGGIHMEMPIFG